MKKTFALFALLFTLFISTGCAMKEDGYGARGQMPGDLQAVQSAQATSATDPATLQLIEMNKTLMIMLQKQNGQQTATVQQSPAVMKLNLEALGEKKSPAPVPIKAKPRKVKPRVHKPAEKTSAVNSNNLDKRVSAVENVVDDLQARMDFNHPGQDVSKVKFGTSSSALTQADKNKLYAEVVKSWFEGKINLLGIAVYDKADADIADMRYTEMLNFISSYGIPRTLLGKRVSKRAAVNDSICHVIIVDNDPSVIEKNRQERWQYRIGAATAPKK